MAKKSVSSGLCAHVYGSYLWPKSLYPVVYLSYEYVRSCYPLLQGVGLFHAGIAPEVLLTHWPFVTFFVLTPCSAVMLLLLKAVVDNNNVL